MRAYAAEAPATRVHRRVAKSWVFVMWLKEHAAESSHPIAYAVATELECDALARPKAQWSIRTASSRQSSATSGWSWARDSLGTHT